MTTTNTFDSTKDFLHQMLRDIGAGKTQLPDFQRGWVWDDNHIRSLLASVSVGFPIGAVMLLETGDPGLRFKPRPIEGTDPSLQEIEPEILILDGQQRLTSLYQALARAEPVQTKDAKGKKIGRRYYFDMKASLDGDGDREDAILSIPEDGLVKAFGGEVVLDLSTVEKEYEQSHFPAFKVFDSAGWRREYSKHWNYDENRVRLFDEFEERIIKAMEQYQIPLISLSKKTQKEAVCLVFEKVNTGGVSLTVFELVTASFAAENFQLREDWEKRERGFKHRFSVLQDVQSDDFLQAVTLLATLKRRRNVEAAGNSGDRAPAISCKRKDILRLTVSDYTTWADKVINGLERAARFLHRQKIFRARDLPYRTQLVPLATILADLGQAGESEGAIRRVERWFWSGVLGELYGGAIETRFARDLPEVTAWVRGAEQEPISVSDASFAASRLLTLRTRNSAAYKGLYALLMRDRCLDFRTGDPIEAQTFFDEKIDIHHVFPKAWCDDNNVVAGHRDCIVNKTAISARTNRSIGGKAPSRYLDIVERNSGIPEMRMDEILESHLIDPAALRSDGFERFFQLRGERLLERIEAAMGKQAVRDAEVFQEFEDLDQYEDEPEDWEDVATSEVTNSDERQG